MLEQKIKDLDGKKSKDPWELEAKDFIPVFGLFNQVDRMGMAVKEGKWRSPRELGSDYFIHYFPRRALTIFYNIALVEAVITIGHKIYQQF